MSSRSKRAKHTEPEATTSSRRTTTTTTSHSERRRQRSVSPFNISRNEEKEELAHLNDRLASYIDYVRKLELDKENLKRKIKTFSEERLVSPQTNYPCKICLFSVNWNKPFRARMMTPGARMKLR